MRVRTFFAEIKLWPSQFVQIERTRDDIVYIALR